MALPQPNEYYTYEDYCTWDDSMRWELIDGVPYAMSPAPRRKHQSIVGNVFNQLSNFLKGKPCKVYIAPFDVRLRVNDDDDTVVQPDILVVCDSTKLDDKGCNGAPDFVCEVVSLSSARHDRMIKLNLYQRAGVKEYWIIDPETQTVQVNILKDGLYYVKAFGDADTAPVEVLPSCEITLSEVFAD